MHQKCVVPGCYNTPGKTARKIWSLARDQKKMPEVIGMCEPHIRDTITRKRIQAIANAANNQTKTIVINELTAYTASKILGCSRKEVHFLIEIKALDGKNLHRKGGQFTVKLKSLVTLVEAIENGDIDHPQLVAVPGDLIIKLINQAIDVRKRLDDYNTQFPSALD